MKVDAQMLGLRLAYIAIALGAIVFAAVVFVLRQEGLLDDGFEDLEFVSTLAAASPFVLIPTAFALRGVMRGKAALEDDVQTRFNVFRASVIVFGATLEGAVLFNIVAWMLGGDVALNGGMAMLTWAVMLAGMPTQDQFESLRS